MNDVQAGRLYSTRILQIHLFVLLVCMGAVFALMLQRISSISSKQTGIEQRLDKIVKTLEESTLMADGLKTQLERFDRDELQKSAEQLDVINKLLGEIVLWTDLEMLQDELDQTVEGSLAYELERLSREPAGVIRRSNASWERLERSSEVSA
ncbi:hypothetical protein WMF26_27425 [Sorangium sp. So ce185]|uniref:hypothetical protein n=1 Tax=Sorangium sp. So ce185 TaxID=3133287 RepID=UPI003F63AB5A